MRNGLERLNRPAKEDFGSSTSRECGKRAAQSGENHRLLSDASANRHE